MFYPRLQTNINTLLEDFDNVPAQRKTELARIAAYIQQRRKRGDNARLIFICTHNSRRSHMCQIWAQTAASHYRIAGIQTYSGGTQVTAFNPRSVAALQRVGFDIVKATRTQNPLYDIRYRDDAPVLTAFSKIYNEPPNPKAGFCAVVTCNHADETCPVIAGADLRVVIPISDPKASDDSAQETQTYDQCVRQTGREMFYAFSLVARQ